MWWVTKVSSDKVFVLDTVDWLEHEYTTSNVLRLKGVLGVDKGTIFPCFNLYRRYYGLHNVTVKGTHFDLMFTPTDITLINTRGNFEGKVLVVPPIVTRICEDAFYGIKVGTLDVSHFDTDKVINMSNMFAGCQAKNLDVSHFDTRGATNMYGMFWDCQTTELDVSHFDTSHVTNMSRMFVDCRVTELDVSHFDTRQVTEAFA